VKSLRGVYWLLCRETSIKARTASGRTHFMAIIVSTAERSHQPTGKLPVWLVDVEIDGTRRSMHVTAPDIIEARKAVAKRLRIPFSPS
jgi:hypothetical protein